MTSIKQFFMHGEEPCGEVLHYTECGLDNIYLQGGFTIEEIDGEEYLTIADMDGLHKAIGLHIVMERKSPTGKEMRFLRRELDMSQSELASILGVTDQSVARWEKGQTEPGGPAVLSLRLVYLLSLLPSGEREKVLTGIVERLGELARRDEGNADIVLTYKGDNWQDAAIAV
ncbi:MAG: helix-turn-helix domain-containing protein [Rhizobiaceae bacterium]|nr:helix-turn-helix domain-containing protein [Rhizobiaceae bacterium]